MIAEIIPEIKTSQDIESFSYLVPAAMQRHLPVGSLVVVPFGKRKIRGIVSQINVKGPDTKSRYQLREIIAVDEKFVLPKEYLEIARWVADYYLCSLGEAISLFLPPWMKRPRIVPQAESKKLKVESEKIKLSIEQEKIFRRLKQKFDSSNTKPSLLFGVTGSGKTEIYIKLAKEIIKSGKQVVVLVPEIILTPQTVERFEEILSDQVCLMHSHLSKSEKYQCFFDFYSGRKPIIIGPRSALLVPCSNLGLAIIDEEQEDSFKQEQNPRYHAVDLAENICNGLKAQLLLGSATPRIETFYKTIIKEYDLFILHQRYLKDELPRSTVIDLRDEIKSNNLSPISITLQDEIKKVLEEKQQILLFLNRRGSATFVSCRDCGHVILCKNCSIPLVFHLNSSENILSCHHCNYQEKVPAHCPKCQSPRIKFFGAGVDKIESEVKKLFPAARVARVDSTTIKSKNDYYNFYQKFKQGEIDIVIGTQIVAKGLDIPGVDLVGIISADTGLHLPQYRATERVFQILTQVSGRSGRRKDIGQTIIQTYWPDSAPTLAASQHNYQAFYEREILDRKKFDYPPFTHLINIISEDKNEERAKKNIEKVAQELKTRKINFIGPGRCFYQRLHRKYRYHIIIKSKSLPIPLFHEIVRTSPHIIFDVDPVSLL